MLRFAFDNCYVLVVGGLIGCGLLFGLLALVRFYLLVWFVCVWQLWVLGLVCCVLFAIGRLHVNSVVICVKFCISFWLVVWIVCFLYFVADAI